MINKIGVIGIGIVGSAVYKFFSTSSMCDIVIGYDKYISEFNNEEYKKNLLTCDMLFLCLPTPYKHELNNYDHSVTEDWLKWLSDNNYENLILIKSTIEPTKTEIWNDMYTNIKIIHNPEFLTSRTNYTDFENQEHILLGYTKYSVNTIGVIVSFYEKYFPNAKISIGKSTETEMMKIWCNSFYSIKIQIFNEIYHHSKKLNVDFDTVKTMMLNNGWIHPMHTQVPGPDGYLGYGGACFPKDTNALLQHLKRNDCMHSILENTIIERNQLRDFEFE
jgi:UDPglucose 6-dehydrogenase